jgi:hypothetical protein
MNKTVRLTESDLTRLVKKIINESIPPALVQVLRNLDNVIKSRTVQRLESLLKNNEIDNFIYVNGQRGSIRNGNQVLDNFINGRLTSIDSEKVFNAIFKTAEDPKDIDAMADFLMSQDKFVSKYNGKTKEEIISELTPKYGEKQAKVLAKKLPSKTKVRDILSLLNEAWGEAWQTPGLLKVISKIRGSVDGVASWKLFMKWLVTGTTRRGFMGFDQVYKELLKSGFSAPTARTLAKVVISLGFEAFQRWLVLNLTITILKMFVEYWRYQDSPEQDRRSMMASFDIFWERVLANWSGWGFGWVWPVADVAPIVYRLAVGILKVMPPGQLYDYVINERLPVNREAISLDNQVMKELDYGFSSVQT